MPLTQNQYIILISLFQTMNGVTIGLSITNHYILKKYKAVPGTINNIP